MTDPTPLHRTEAISSDDHNAGMQHDVATVVAIAEPSDALVRVTLHVPGLGGVPEWTHPNMALRFYLRPEFGDVSRIYTVRSADVRAETIDVDVVRHGADSPMMLWVNAIAPGDTVEFVGPRPHFRIPPTDGRVALFADATAVPALYALLIDALPDVRGEGWIATDDEVAFAELPQTDHLVLHRVPADGGHLAYAQSVTPSDGLVVWGAGERDEMRAVRSHFRHTVGLAKDDVRVFGYWKRGRTNTDIDAHRLRAYQDLLAAGGTVGDLDDLALDI